VWPRRKILVWSLITIALVGGITIAAALAGSSAGTPAPSVGGPSGVKEEAVVAAVQRIDEAVRSYAGYHGGRFPASSIVCQEGLSGYAYWPQNPFTGAPMDSGTTAGQYTYTLKADGSYGLVGCGATSEAVVHLP
jgi:hypothetical protein